MRPSAIARLLGLRRAWGAGVCLLVLAAGSAQAQSRQLQAVSDEIASLGVRLQTLITDYDGKDVVERVGKFSERLTDAEILYLLGDYPRASILLFDLTRDVYGQEPLYNKALYYLGESQFQMGNDIAARDSFDKLVARRDREHLSDAIKRLIEIADRTRDWSGIDQKVALLHERGRLPPSIAYINGKSLLRQGKLGDVETVVRDVPRSHPVWPKSYYLLGVAELRLGQLDRALGIFEELSKVPNTYDDARLLRDLSKMNAARIRIEQGRLADAVDAYQDIPRSSPYFEESLYEITWTYVRAAHRATSKQEREKAYNEALKALEILLLSETGTTLAPEARILLGNILLRLRKYDEATEAFNEVVQRYEPVREELAKLAANVTDPAAYYEDIVERSRAGGGLLPPLAVKWAAEQRELKQALGVVKDIDQGETWIAESQAVIDKLLTILQSDQRASFFPALHDAHARLLEIDNNLVSMSHRLLELERGIVKGELDPARRAALEKVLEERARLEPAYRQLPKKREDYEGRLESMKGRMQDLQRSAFRLKWEVEEMRRSVVALDQWLADNAASLPKKDEEQIRSRVDQARREVAELETLQGVLEGEIAKEKSLLTLSTEEQAREEELRARYAATLEQEKNILDVGAAAVVGEERKLLEEIAQQREVLSRYHVDLEAFKGRLAKVVNEKSYDIKAKLLQEQASLEQHAQAIQSARADAKRVVGEIAIDSLRGVEEDFRNIVLRGDVGIIDVAWSLKEAKTHQISRRVNEQRRELAILDNEYQGIMEE